MNDLYAIIPASAIILIIAIRKILAPIQFNEEIFGEIHPDEVNKCSIHAYDDRCWIWWNRIDGIDAWIHA